MGTAILILTIIGALLALFSGVRALRAWLSFRRTHRAFQAHLLDDVTRLAARTSELEKNLAAVEARSQQLPVTVARLQENLATLQVLTNSLAVSLRQAQRVLSFSGFKTFSAARLADLLPDFDRRPGR